MEKNNNCVSRQVKRKKDKGVRAKRNAEEIYQKQG